MIDVVAIVVVHNGIKWLSKCFESLRGSTVPIHIIAIDNNSSDGSAQYLRKNFPDVELICLNENVGFGKANNIGLKRGLELGVDYVFLLNQDAWIAENTISELISASKNNPKYGILSPVHFSSDEFSLEKQFLQFLSDQNTENFINDCFFGKMIPVYTTQYIHAAAWLITRDCLTKVGGFDPLFYHYGEDDDYIERVKYFGFQLGIVTNAPFVHDANYKNWEMVEWDKNRNQILLYLMLKRMTPHFRSNLLLFLKNTFDELTTLLLFRKWRKFVFKLRIFFSVSIKMNMIYKSYKASFNQRSFL
jgi:GT2 family glycosyltransferase